MCEGREEQTARLFPSRLGIWLVVSPSMRPVLGLNLCTIANVKSSLSDVHRTA